MITNEGRIYIKRYLAGFVPSIGTTIAFGLGDKIEEVHDRRLNFEMGRANISLVSYDFIADKLVFKAPLPVDVEGTIYEVGLFSQERNALSGDFDSNMISSFDSDTEDWTDLATLDVPTYASTNSRFGADSLRLSAVASGTSGALLEGIGLDLSGHSSADRFKLAYFQSANVAAVQVLLKGDEANYYTLDFSPSTSAYRIQGATIGSAQVTGDPDWAEINAIEVRVTATSGGTATVDFDGFRIEDTDTPNPEYVLVSRELLAAPFVKEAGRIQAIEFTLDVAV